MKTITFVVPVIGLGGVGKYIITLANELSKFDYKIHVYISQPNGYVNKKLSDRILVYLSNRKIMRPFYFIEEVVRLYNYIKKLRPDIIISASSINYNFLILLLLNISKARTKFIITVHTIYDLKEINSNKISIIKKIINIFNMNFMLPVVYSRANKIIAVSQSIKKHLVEMYRIDSNLIEVIYNPVNMDEIIEKSNDDIDDKIFKDHYPIILAVGRLEPVKQFDLLIKIAKNLTNFYSKLGLIILGEGNERKRLEQLIGQLEMENHVIMPGYKENPYAYMKKADLFVITSKREGMSLVLVEAMACGCKIVSLDCLGAIREILENGKWGRIVSSNEVNAFGVIIKEELQKEHKKKDLIEHAQKYSQKKSINDYLRLIESI